MPSHWQKVVYTPPICIAMRLPFVSRYFCRSIRVRGRWNTPKETSAGSIHHVMRSCSAFKKVALKTQQIITSHDVLEPSTEAQLASCDVIFFFCQIAARTRRTFFTLGDGCWLPKTMPKMRMFLMFSVSTLEGLRGHEDFLRKMTRGECVDNRT